MSREVLDRAPDEPLFKRHLLMAGGAARCGEARPTRTTRVEGEVQCPACLAAMRAESDELTAEDLRAYGEMAAGWRKPAEQPQPDLMAEVPDGELREELAACSVALRSARDLMAQVREALGVGSDAEVLVTIGVLQMTRRRLAQELDESRAKLRDESEISDAHAAWADRLARAALKHTGVHETEEAAEELWRLALDALTGAVKPDGPIVLRLPEPPPGTVALVGKTTRVRYARETTWPVTWRIPGHRDAMTLLEVFQDSGPELEAELAPEPEPQPRTAVEVWRSISKTGRHFAVDHAELREALDREAGL
jgi:muconolactone delta-isomerase